uniref:Uncharacterized protein n=1 Tax=Arundo donax TaxID=35708 RepID=A0A0A9F2E2_ARUDO
MGMFWELHSCRRNSAEDVRGFSRMILLLGAVLYHKNGSNTG